MVASERSAAPGAGTQGRQAATSTHDAVKLYHGHASKTILVGILSRLPVCVWPFAGVVIRSCWPGFGRC
jgi:hypothetical protein